MKDIFLWFKPLPIWKKAVVVLGVPLIVGSIGTVISWMF